MEKSLGRRGRGHENRLFLMREPFFASVGNQGRLSRDRGNKNKAGGSQFFTSFPVIAPVLGERLFPCS